EANFVGKVRASKMVMKSTPLLASIWFLYRSATVCPSGVIAPMPVMTTRLRMLLTSTSDHDRRAERVKRVPPIFPILGESDANRRTSLHSFRPTTLGQSFHALHTTAAHWPSSVQPTFRKYGDFTGRACRDTGTGHFGSGCS